jgi:hypothetical protein
MLVLLLLSVLACETTAQATRPPPASGTAAGQSWHMLHECTGEVAQLLLSRPTFVTLYCTNDFKIPDMFACLCLVSIAALNATCVPAITHAC